MAVVPGVAAAGAVMLTGFELSDVLGKALLESQGLVAKAGASPISGVPVAILLGLALKNQPLLALPASLDPGLVFCTKKILQTGIICVGAKLSVYDVASTGSACVPAVVTAIGSGLAFTTWASTRMGLSLRMGSLIAAGTSICGVTAITAIAPAIAATQAETAVAVATVVAFGTTSMLTYPVLAHNYLPFEFSEQVGLFLGIAIHDTAQVMGAGMTYKEMYGDEVALQWASITKLTRNLFLAAAIPVLVYRNAVAEAAASATASATASAAATAGLGGASGLLRNVYKHTPGFVYGFIGMSALRSIGDATSKSSSDGAAFGGMLSKEQWKAATSCVSNVGSKYLLGTAMAAVGLSTSAAVFKGVGYRPFAVGLAGAGVVGGAGLASAVAMGKLGLVHTPMAR